MHVIMPAEAVYMGFILLVFEYTFQKYLIYEKVSYWEKYLDSFPLIQLNLWNRVSVNVVPYIINALSAF